MKPSMIFAIVMMTVIILIVSFGMQLDSTPSLMLAPDAAGRALFVCPAEDSVWDSIASSIRPLHRHIMFGFFAATFVLVAVWGWNLYQNLLQDKFTRTSFTKVWQVTKILFWGGVILLLLATTPNKYRRVTLDGATGAWVLCESNTPGARAVRANAVHSH